MLESVTMNLIERHLHMKIKSACSFIVDVTGAAGCTREILCN